MKRKFRFLFVLAPVAFVAIGSIITMSLWNWIMPALFTVGTITFWQAAGILLLARVLFGFKGFHHHGFHGHMQYAHVGGGCHPHHGSRHEFMRQRWESLSPEQKEKLKKRCGHSFESKQQEPEKEA
ncbi:MAG: hypothetical protein IPH88_18505 [Bacteroidales bacterium]|nr:hypothetical protein [Bacteroidales bacterium]